MSFGFKRSIHKTFHQHVVLEGCVEKLHNKLKYNRLLHKHIRRPPETSAKPFINIILIILLFIFLLSFLLFHYCLYFFPIYFFLLSLSISSLLFPYYCLILPILSS